jgi:peptidoglycan DL-endopeptidase CwlO
VAALAAGALVTALLPGSGGADTAPALRDRAAALGRTEHAVLLDLYALESSLARARSRADVLRARSSELELQADRARRQARIVRDGLVVSRVRVADTVRRLYVEGDTDPIAVILGATSVDEAMTAIDTLERTADRHRRLATELARQLVRLHAAQAQLGARRAALADALAAAEAAERELSQRVAGKEQYLVSLRRQRSLAAARLGALEARAQAAERTSARLTPTPAATAPVEKPVLEEQETTGAQTLVVDAVAYHLPGRTASGLPVGPGVAAVDPAVIPLGTRMFVPGYGPAIAADVGSAIRGAMIDLWFPTTAQALAWGRRTVSITLYP